ncbi:MAG: biotin carboxylase N-terminal domain-containing protein [Planctomycetota bacterium]|nr:biotin carboxylase N-terminal domain-containing protein [Planctomycetota bacterium]
MSAPHPITTLLVANRGEIAVRVIRAAHELGMRTVAVYSDADRTSLHVRMAHEAVRLGPAAPSESYLRIDRILEACKATGAQAVHPGYGFLAESAEFVEACEAAGVIFVGPSAAAMRAMGDKISARATVEPSGVPVVPGATLTEGADDAAILATACGVGFPQLVKASAGGGGKGMRLVREEGEVLDAIARASGEALTAFGDGTVYLERFIEEPRHVEIQVLADNHGTTVALGERECSVQRRHQKVIEESPSPALTPELRARMEAAAVAAAESCGYRSAGTVEFLVGADGGFHFLEMNTRIQVEHPITEMCYRVDLLAEQLRIAQGLPISFGRDVPVPAGHAIEARICAEDADHGFMPSTGTLGAVQLPGGPGVRCDGHVYVGQEVGLDYDNMLLKLIVHADDRATAIERMKRALWETRLPGITTNIPLMLRTLDDPRFTSGHYDTSILEGSAPPAEEAADLVPVIAAALAMHRRVRRTHVPPASPGTRPAPWVQAGRSWWNRGTWGS